MERRIVVDFRDENEDDVTLGCFYVGVVSEDGSYFDFEDDAGDSRVWRIECFGDAAKEPNAMPSLEAGMIVVADWEKHVDDGDDEYNNVLVYINDDYLVDDKGFMELSALAISKVFKQRPTVLSALARYVVNSEPIWERQPEKTEAQLKIEELRKTLDELEAIEASKN